MTMFALTPIRSGHVTDDKTASEAPAGYSSEAPFSKYQKVRIFCENNAGLLYNSTKKKNIDQYD